MFKCPDDPIVNKSRSVVLLGWVRVYVGKKDFRRGRRENEIERKRESRSVS